MPVPELPVEITRKILQEFWESRETFIHINSIHGIVEHRSREPQKFWDRYAVCSLVNKQWNALILRVCLEVVFIEDLYTDVEAYMRLRARYSALREAEADPTLPLHVRCRHLRLQSWREDRNGAATRCAQLSNLIQGSQSADVHITTYTKDPMPKLFTLLASAPDLRSLRLEWESEISAVFYKLSGPTMPSVTHLRVGGTFRRDTGKETEEYPQRLLTHFPASRTLHIERPVFLKKLLPAPRALASLVLDATHGRPGFAMVQDWNIPAALNRGLFAGVQGARIIVYTADLKGEPFGWAQARDACAASGVGLERRIL